MYRSRAPHLGATALMALAALFLPDRARADLWRDVTEQALGGATGDWSNKTDVADVDGDGDVDLLFANGSEYSQPDEPQLNGVWLNQGAGEDGIPVFADASLEVLGDEGDFTRVIKGRDVTGDGIVDLIVGNTYETQSRLFVGTGGGKFEERTELLPQMNASVGDLEVGDVDGDGDLDIVLSDWGLDTASGALADPFKAKGARPLVWINRLNESAGRFVDESEARVADVAVAWAWEIELVDIDGDFDLDMLASSKTGTGSALLVNEDGKFVSSKSLPQFTNNYDFEPMFIQMPGDEVVSLAVITINDGVQVSHKFDLRERIFVADAQGRFEDATAAIWPDKHNKGEDDNMVVVLDFDSDGDPDFLIGALGDGPDRLHVNELATEGHFSLDSSLGLATGLDNTPGTLGIALADFNGDGKLDVVQSQGELADPERIWLGDEIAPDTAKPIVLASRALSGAAGVEGIVARVHDNRSPSRPHDWNEVAVIVSVDGEEIRTEAMTWTGEFMWRADLDGLPAGAMYRVCATDAAGNEGCGELTALGDAKEDDASHSDDVDGESASCRVGGAPASTMMLGLMVLALARRRRR